MLIGRGWRVDGVEPSPRRSRPPASRGVDARAGTLSSLALDESAYDLVTFMHSLEHTVEPVRDLRRAARATRPGGLVAVTVPNFGGTQARLFGGRWFHLDVPRHRHHFTGEGLRRGARGRGAEGGAHRHVHQRGGAGGQPPVRAGGAVGAARRPRLFT